MARDYELKRRAEQMEETRLRIVEAAIELHETIGPARTSVSAIAERAGVQRQTYYRHFPDERSLGKACSGLCMERNPLPDAESWRAIADPDARLRHGLTELYAFYAANERMLANVIRDAEIDELTREMADERMGAAMAQLRDALAEAVRTPALDLALDFNTWRLLVRGSGLSQDEAVDLVVDMLRCSARL